MYRYGGNDFDAKPRMGRKRKPFDPELCGTGKGPWQHRRDNQPNCDKCKTHYNAGRRQRRQQQANERFKGT